ncbi:hypothetical protein P4474_09405 [Geobacillus stearothermophilus]|uniref:hypothetical protein n=1 Tax=Geobacillus stearothermophilus TaxID=1422 RepID=UPI002E224400|nr:hypothetical protein [Geobacillus stearothermophilus]
MSMLIKYKAAYILIIILFFFLIDALFVQIQMVFTNGDIILPKIFLKGLLLIISLICMIFVKEIRVRHRNFIICWFIFLLYLIVNLIYMINKETNYSIGYLLFSYNAYYFFIIIAPLILFFENTISPKNISKIFFVTVIPLAILGVAQFILNEPLVRVTSNDGYFKILSYDYYGNIRSFSLFSSGFSFGQFLVIVECLIISIILRRKKISLIFFFLLIVFTIYTTLTRNVFIEFLLATFNILILNFFVHKKIFKAIAVVLPLFWGCIFIVLIFSYQKVLSFLYGLGISELLLKQDSFLYRLGSSKEFIQHFSDLDLMEQLFGLGIIQHDRFENTQSFLIDNGLLAVVGHIGLIGLFLLLAIYFNIWFYMINRDYNKSILDTAFIGFFSTFFATNLFNINLEIYVLLFFLFILSDSENFMKKYEY